MRGFTLIEMLVVVAIIAVLSSALLVNAWPSDAAAAEREARRLAALLETAMSEARASARAIAWTPEENGYSFWQRTDEGTWERFPETSVYRHRRLAAQTRLRAERTVLTPSGLQGPMEATLSGGTATIILRRQALGRISLERIHAD